MARLLDHEAGERHLQGAATANWTNWCTLRTLP